MIGTWAMHLHVYTLPGLTEITSQALGGEVMPRRQVYSVHCEVSSRDVWFRASCFLLFAVFCSLRSKDGPTCFAGWETATW